MIEINLLPGSTKRRSPRSFLPSSLPAVPELNWLTAFLVAAWIIGPAVGLWLFLSVRGDMRDTEEALVQAVADSARYANVIQTQASLRARQDTIAQKLAMIQEIDAGRYVWSHVLDEVSKALPPFTWLEAIEAMSEATQPQFQIQGRTGSLPALTRLMRALEASPFLRDIDLVSSEQGTVGRRGEMVHNFILIGEYEPPPLDLVETVPLFGEAQADSAVAGEASDGAPGTS